MLECMKKIFLLALPLLAPWVAARAQVVVVAPPSEYAHVKDSITRHYYPGMFDGASHGEPMMPTEQLQGYRSKMYNAGLPRDSIRCMYEIKFFGHTGDDGTDVDKQKDGRIGTLNLFWVDLTSISRGGSAPLYVLSMPIKQLKKRYRFKFAVSVECLPPEYRGKELKRITAAIEYVPHLASSSAEFRVEHLPYGAKAKGIRYANGEHAKFLGVVWEHTSGSHEK